MKKLTIIFFTSILFVSAGCKKSFFDINQNPNSPTEESITPELMLPRAIQRVVQKATVSYSNYAGWMGYYSRSGTYGANPATEGYNITSSFEADEWNDWFDILYDLDVAEKKAAASGKNYYVAMAKIMKSIGFMYLVDQYNNVPYSKAFDLKNNLTPSYDKGPAIYADLIVQLNTAIELLGAAGVDSDPGITNVDIVFHKSVSQWRKLANTQKLRLLIHQSEVISAGDATAELAKTASVGYLDGITTPFGGAVMPTDGGAYVQPGYVADNLKQNPFWDTYDTAPSGSSVNDFWRANNFMLLQMYGISGDNYVDERLFYTYDEVGTATGNTLQAHYLGTNYGEITPNTGPQAINQSDVSGPGLSVSASQAQWLFTVVESRFLQAEAIQRGWIPGNARTAYESAVASSFKFLGVPDEIDPTPNNPTNGDTYNVLEDYFTYPISNWDAAVNSNKIKLIATQKYIALMGLNNFEGWVDYRRLDGAEAILSSQAQQAQLLSFSPERGGKDIPLRLIYAQSEYNYNAANVGAEGTINPHSSRIFWDKGPR